MKKRIVYLLIAAFCMSCLAACGNKATDTPSAPSVDAAKEYLDAMYKKDAEVTASDYKVVSVVKIDNVIFDVTWTVDVAAGITITPDAATKLTLIDIDEKTPSEVAYVLTATIKDADGKTATTSYKHTIPAYKEATWADYINTAANDNVVCTGIVNGIISKTNGNSSNCIYFQDSDGGYYVYGMADDPVALGIKVGMTVKATGIKDLYSGTHEIKNATVEILDSTIKEVAPVDFTEIFKKAESLKDEKLVAQQSMLVTVKGVEIGEQETASGYLYFTLDGKKSYLRISSSVCPAVKDKDAIISAHAEHIGWTADVTGVICVYDGAFYLTPVDANCFNYVGMAEKTDAEKVEFEAEALKFADKYTEAAELDAAIAGKTFENVKIAWTSSNEAAIKFADGKAVVTPLDADAKVTVKATLTCGDASKEVTFEILVEAAATDTYVSTVVTAPVADTAYKYGFVQVSLGKTLYITGTLSGRYAETTENPAKAADVFVETVDGGYRLYLKNGDAKTYLEVGFNADNKTAILLVTEPTITYTLNESNVFVAKVGEKEYYAGTYKTYDTMSVSESTYITGDNAANIGVSQFPAQLMTVELVKTEVEKVTTPAADTAYKYGFVQASLEKTLFITGTLSGRYAETTEKVEKAADVKLEHVDGGYRLYFMNGETKTYLEVGFNADNKTAILFVTEPTITYTLNESNVFVAKVGEKEYYAGTYKTYDTMSVSETTYITGDNAANIGVSQFPAQLFVVK